MRFKVSGLLSSCSISVRYARSSWRSFEISDWRFLLRSAISFPKSIISFFFNEISSILLLISKSNFFFCWILDSLAMPSFFGTLFEDGFFSILDTPMILTWSSSYSDKFVLCCITSFSSFLASSLILSSLGMISSDILFSLFKRRSFASTYSSSYIGWSSGCIFRSKASDLVFTIHSELFFTDSWSDTEALSLSQNCALLLNIFSILDESRELFEDKATFKSWSLFFRSFEASRRFNVSHRVDTVMSSFLLNLLSGSVVFCSFDL